MQTQFSSPSVFLPPASFALTQPLGRKGFEGASAFAMRQKPEDPFWTNSLWRAADRASTRHGTMVCLLEAEAPVGILPSIELLESTHKFPGPYVFKVIGRVENGFAARVVAAVREELAAPIDPPHSVRETAGRRHISVTLEPVVQTGSEVIAVYQRIRKLAGLVLLW